MHVYAVVPYSTGKIVSSRLMLRLVTVAPRLSTRLLESINHTVLYQSTILINQPYCIIIYTVSINHTYQSIILYHQSYCINQSYCRHAAHLLDLHHPAATVHCAMAKRASTDRCAEVCDEALQLLGGYGYLQAYEVERYVRDVRYGWMDGWMLFDEEMMMVMRR